MMYVSLEIQAQKAQEKNEMAHLNNTHEAKRTVAERIAALLADNPGAEIVTDSKGVQHVRYPNGAVQMLTAALMTVKEIETIFDDDEE